MRSTLPSGRSWLAGGLAAVVLVGCGGSAHRSTSGHEITLPAYAGFPAATQTVTRSGGPDSPLCRLDAQAIVRDAEEFLAHIGPASTYPADLAYLDLRKALISFAGRHCDSKLVAEGLRTRLTPAQRRRLVANLPTTIADALTAALGS